MKKINIFGLCVITLAAASFLGACSSEPQDPNQIQIIKVGNSSLTVREFKQIQDMAQDYYWQEGSGEISTSSGESDKLRLLNQVTEELLLTERAKELGITVSDEELEAAVQDIRADYPDETFEQVLLENAVPYNFWRQRLKVRLLMDKVVEKELESRVTISAEDIAAFIKENYSDGEDRPDTEKSREKKKDINEVIVKRLRKLKAEEAYKDWIKELQKTHPVEVNWKAWKEMADP